MNRLLKLVLLAAVVAIFVPNDRAAAVLFLFVLAGTAVLAYHYLSRIFAHTAED